MAETRAPVADTIVAIATPPGRGGVGIVRLSGPRCDAIAQALLGATPAPRLATYAPFRDAAGAALDTGLALWFPAPHSYTGESVLELQGHGSPAALRAVVGRCLELGARLAQPGEFTRRAFLNGRIDLAQAEGVADLIEAASSTAARAAIRTLTGEFSRAIGAAVADLTELRARAEASLDFPEEDIAFVHVADAAARLERVRAALAALTRRARQGVRLREGLTVVLVGRPNVGKSSLLNRLAREDVAIVADAPGTTRDTVERAIEIDGVPVIVVDTAGLRDADEAVERLGIARTWAAVARADVAIVLVDAREPDEGLTDDDRAVLSRLPQALPRLVAHNKSDLAGVAARVERSGATVHAWMSALTGDGVAELEAEVRVLAGVDAAGEDSFIARERHLVALEEARARLAAAAAELALVAPALELVAEELRLAQRALSSITGEFTADDLLGEIFARFCIGK